jgi:hypothetical protein
MIVVCADSAPPSQGHGVKSLVKSSAVIANKRFDPLLPCSAAFRNAIVTSRFFGSGGELIAQPPIHYFR